MRAALIYLVLLQQISTNVSASASYLSLAVDSALSLAIRIKEPVNVAKFLAETIAKQVVSRKYYFLYLLSLFIKNLWQEQHRYRIMVPISLL